MSGQTGMVGHAPKIRIKKAKDRAKMTKEERKAWVKEKQMSHGAKRNG